MSWAQSRPLPLQLKTINLFNMTKTTFHKIFLHNSHAQLTRTNLNYNYELTSLKTFPNQKHQQK